MSEYLGQRDVLFDPSNGGQPDNSLQHYHDHLPVLAALTDAPSRFPGAIWPANNPVGTEYVQGAGNPSGPFVPAPQPGWNAQRIMSDMPQADLAMGMVLGLDSPAGRNPLTVYHGTPHTFPPTERNPLGEFDNSKIDTGQGAQMYGQGAYVAEHEPVAADYRKTLTQHLDYQTSTGGKIPDWIGNDLSRSTALTTPGTWADKLDSHIADFQHRLYWERNELNDPNNAQPWMTRERIGNMEDVIRSLQELQAGKAELLPRGRMYEAELHADPEHFLDWDQPLTEQSQHVQDALQRMVQAREGANDMLWRHPTSGEEINLSTMGDAERAATERTLQKLGYGKLQERWRHDLETGPQEMAKGTDPGAQAQALHDAGIAGIRYADAGSRVYVDDIRRQKFRIAMMDPNKVDPGEIAKERLRLEQMQKMLTRNYVVFDPTTLNIVRRYGIPALIGGGAAAGASNSE